MLPLLANRALIACHALRLWLHNNHSLRLQLLCCCMQILWSSGSAATLMQWNACLAAASNTLAATVSEHGAETRANTRGCTMTNCQGCLQLLCLCCAAVAELEMSRSPDAVGMPALQRLHVTQKLQLQLSRLSCDAVVELAWLQVLCLPSAACVELEISSHPGAVGSLPCCCCTEPCSHDQRARFGLPVTASSNSCVPTCCAA